MKQFVTGLVVAVIPLLLAYYINQRNPDLRYQLSGPIEVDTSSPLGRVQQIEIANTGNAVAQKVQIKIKKPVSNIHLTKDSESDNVQRFTVPPQATELDYDALRPAGRIKISMMSADSLTEQDIEIRDQDGLAKAALVPENRALNILRELVLFVPFVLYSVLVGLALVKQPFTLKCKSHPVEALEGKKPLLLSHENWAECLMEEAAPRCAKRELGETGDVSSWQIYRLLNAGKPKSLPDGIWAKVLPTLIDEFTSRLKTEAQQQLGLYSGSAETIRKLLGVPKPTVVFDEKWDSLRRDLSAMYASKVVASALTNYPQLSSFAATLDQIELSSELDQSDRERARRLLRGLYRAALIEEIKSASKPTTTLREANLKHLTEADTRFLTEFAYQLQMNDIAEVSTPYDAEKFLNATKPEFISDDDYARLTKIATAIKKAEDDQRCYTALMSNLRRLLTGGELGSAPPSEVKPEDWTALKRLEQELGQHHQAAALTAKVLRQLEIIDILIKDPSVVDRIEEYETTFAAGNLANLKKLAQLLRSSAKT